MNNKCILLATLCFFLSGCNLGICTWNMGYSQVSIEPKDNEVIGVYYLSKTSKAKFSGEGLDLSHTKLTLKSDHQYILVDGPAAIVDERNTKQTIIKAGRWFVTCDNSEGCMIELEGICVVSLCKKDERFSIPIGIGDPDQCEGIIFEKAK